MTTQEFEICQALGHRVEYGNFSGFDRRFGWGCSTIDQETELTEKQREWIYRLLYKYRRQLPDLYEIHKSNPLCSKKELKPKTNNHEG